MVGQVFFPQGKVLGSPDDFTSFHLQYSIHQVETHSRLFIPNYFSINHFQCYRELKGESIPLEIPTGNPEQNVKTGKS
jgi:hypothetical protein